VGAGGALGVDAARGVVAKLAAAQGVALAGAASASGAAWLVDRVVDAFARGGRLDQAGFVALNRFFFLDRALASRGDFSFAPPAPGDASVLSAFPM
jgi:hypothetical protein